MSRRRIQSEIQLPAAGPRQLPQEALVPGRLGKPQLRNSNRTAPPQATASHIADIVPLDSPGRLSPLNLAQKNIPPHLRRDANHCERPLTLRNTSYTSCRCRRDKDRYGPPCRHVRPAGLALACRIPPYAPGPIPAACVAETQLPCRPWSSPCAGAWQRLPPPSRHHFRRSPTQAAEPASVAPQ